MKEEQAKRVCPICGCEYADHPSISRADDETPICPDCGTREALDSIGVPTDEQDEIIGIIHRARRHD